MTSKTSLSEGKRGRNSGFAVAYRFGLRQGRGAFFLYSGLLLFLPILFTLICNTFRRYSSYEDSVAIAETMVEALHVLLGLIGKPVSLVFSAVFGIQLFGFMHKKRSVDTFHALPVRRIPLLSGLLAAALTYLLLPLVCALLLCGLIGIANLGSFSVLCIEYLLPTIGYVLLGLTASFAFILFMLVVSATVMDAVVSALILSLAYPVLYLLMQLFLDRTMQGYSAQISYMGVTALSPFAAYLGQSIGSLITGVFGVGGVTSLAASPSVWYVPWWLLATVALIGLSLLMYRRRKSEHAESTYAFWPLKESMKFLISAFAAFGLGCLAALIYESDLVFIIFALLGGFAANTIVEALYSRGLRHFGRGCIVYGVFAVAFMGFYLAAIFGGFGYGAAAPAAKDVLYCTANFATLNVPVGAQGSDEDALPGAAFDHDNVYLYSGREYIARVREAYEGEEAVQQVIAFQKLLSRRLLPSVHLFTQDNTTDLNITYYLKGGGTLVRAFKIPNDVARTLDSLDATDADVLEAQEQVRQIRSRRLAIPVELDDFNDDSTVTGEMLYSQYTHADEIAELEKIEDPEAFDKKQTQLIEKYGDRLYEVSEYNYSFDFDTLDDEEREELLTLLFGAWTDVGSSNNIQEGDGWVNLRVDLPVGTEDSIYLQRLAGGRGDLHVETVSTFYFTHTADKLVQFIREHGECNTWY